MPTVEKTKGGRYRSQALEDAVTAGDQVTVDEETATYLCNERDDFRRVTILPFDPGELTISELEERLETDHGEQYDQQSLEALLAAEKDGDDRDGATDAIADVIEE